MLQIKTARPVTKTARKTAANTAETAKSDVKLVLAREALRILWLGAILFMILSLTTYSPEDPSWTTWSTRSSFHNWMGRTGSILADVSIQVLGAGAIAGTFILLIVCAQLPTVSSLFGLAVVVFFCTLCQLSLQTHYCPWNLKYPGGLVGFGMQKALGFLFGSKGSVLVAWTLLLVFSVLFFQIQILSPLAKMLRALATRSKTGGVILWEAFQACANALLQIQLPRFRRLTTASPSIAGSVAGQTLGNPISIKSQTPTTHLPAEPAVSFSFPLPPTPILATPLAAAPEMADAFSSTARTTAPATPTPVASSFSQAPSPETPAVKPVQLPLPDTERAAQETESNPDNEIFKLAAPKVPKPVKESAGGGRKRNEPFHLPSLQLLSGKRDNQVKTVDRSWYVEKSQVLVQKLKDFGVDGEVVHVSPGPVITVFEFKPASGVKIKEIANLSDDLTLALSVLSVRIVAPIPGKPVVGIEIPTPHRQMVYFKDMLEETPFFNSEIKIPVVLGRLASGEPVVTGCASMPHLLVAGSTGTGKSVFINTLICSLLYRYTPKELKLILVDPKMVELSSYEGIPHLMLPVVVDSRKAALTLRWVVDEMERRYTLMHQSGVRHVDVYNDKVQRELGDSADERSPHEGGWLPYIVVVIDEYADLMAVVPKDVELSIARLAQKARASGIHLVLATQRPSTDVVTGTIKANFPSRISFRVASSVDSKTILDRPGAERLLGNGDMLFHSAGFTTLKRIQGAYISDSDIEAVVEFLRSQGEPEYDELALKASIEEAEGEEAGGGEDGGSLYDQAVRLVAEKGEASISLIQRHLKIGYNRAASLMEQMEKEGVVGEASGTGKRRPVLVNAA